MGGLGKEPNRLPPGELRRYQKGSHRPGTSPPSQHFRKDFVLPDDLGEDDFVVQ